MKIYGVALLAFCFLVGKLAGNMLGIGLDINGDVGGVGFAMILLMVVNTYFRRKGWLALQVAWLPDWLQQTQNWYRTEPLQLPFTLA